MVWRRVVSGILALVIFLSTIFAPQTFISTAAAFEINEDIELDYDWIRHIVTNLSYIINITTNNIHQGRYFGAAGDRVAAQRISQWMNESTVNLRNEGLAKVYSYRIGNNSYESDNFKFQTIVQKSNNKIDILSYELVLSNGTHTATIPNNESFPMPIKMSLGTVSSYGFQDVELFSENDYKNYMPVTISCTYVSLGTTMEAARTASYAKEIVLIEDYLAALEDDTVGKIHFLEFGIEETEDAYHSKVHDVINSGGAGFIMVTTNPSYLEGLGLETLGIAISPYEGEKIKGRLQRNESIVAMFNAVEATQQNTFEICSSSECIGERKVGLIEESGGMVFGKSIFDIMGSLSNRPKKYSDYVGFLLYNKSLVNTHYMMTPTGRIYDNPYLQDGYSNFLFRPFMLINGSVRLDSGSMVNIWEWAEDPNLKASYQIVQKKNDSAESYNVLCEVKGKNSSKNIIISGGHHDFFPGQGASDNAAGVAVMLGVLKWLNETRIQPEYNLTFISFSGEEVVCRGSSCHVFDKRFDEMNKKTIYMLNIDWIAYDTPGSTLFIAATNHTLTEAMNRTTHRTHYNSTFQPIYGLKVIEKAFGNDGDPFNKRYILGKYNEEDKRDDFNIIEIGKEKETDEGTVGHANMDARHRSGNNHKLGDALGIIDWKDLNVTADIYLNITRFLILEPPENQFVDCEFTPFDICGDTWNDSVNITFNVTTNRMSWVTVEADIRNATTGDIISNNTSWLTAYKTLNASGGVSVTLPPIMKNDTYNVTIRLFDDRGNLDDERYQLIYLSPYSKPIAYFEYTYAGIINHTVHFTDASMPSPGGVLTGWNWNFGDGKSSTKQNPTHIYGSAGEYDVTLTVTDSNGLQDTVVRKLPISNMAPAVSFSLVSSAALVGQAVSFTATAEDYDGMITNYTWDFGDGTYGYDRTVIEHAYEKSGVYSVTLTVTDDCGATNSSTQTKCVIVADAFVDDSYPFDIPSQHKWKALQSGIDDAATRDGILYVFNGDYARSTVENPMTIIGESMEGVKLSPAGAPMPCTGILIQADNVTIRNFNVTYCTVGIKVENRALGNVTVESCKILGCYYGVIIDNSTNCTVQDSVFIGNNIGVYLNDASSTLFRRSAISNAQYGIYLEDSSGNWIGSPPVYDWYPTDCTFTYCDYGIYLYGSDNNFIIGCAINGTPHWEMPETMTTGIYLDTSHQNTISTCYIHGTTDKGVFLSAAAYNKIEHCKIVDNPYGIKLSGSLTAHNLICQNNISCNTYYALYIPSEAGENRIVYNDFIDNGKGLTSQSWDANGRSGQENIWCKSEAPLLTVTADGEGNYWSDYTGEDLNEDGVGDTPYVIASGRVWREDTYPLMRPYGWCADWE